MRFSFFSRWLFKLGTVSALVLGSAPAQQALAQQASQSDLFNAPVRLRCANDSQRIVESTAYLIALHYGHPESIRDDSQRPAEPGYPFTVRGSVVVYLATKDGILPLTLRAQPGGGYHYLVSCAVEATSPDNYPAVLIRVVGEDDKAELLDLLKRKVAAPAGTNPLSSVLFYGNQPEAALIPLPVPAQSWTYGALVSTYMASHQEAAFLDLFPNSAFVQSAEPGNKIISLKKIGLRSRVAETDDSGRAAPPGVAGASDQADEALKQKPKRKIQLRLVNKALLSMNLMSANAVETFGYCASIKPDGAAVGAYVLEECVTDEKRLVPIRVAGFEPFVIEAGNQPIRLDPLLVSRTYNVPYRVNWQGAATDRVEIQGGSLEEVLKRRVVLRQFGLPACEIGVSLTLADIIGGTLSFPEPPCGTIDLLFPRDMFGKFLPAIAEGCLPNSPAPVSASAEGTARCIVTPQELKAGIKRLKLSWATGFDLVNIDVPAKRGISAALSGPDLAKFLRPSLQQQDGARSDANVPVYRPTEVRYQVRNQPCGKGPLPLGRNAAVPSVAEAGCSGLPDRMDLTFEIDREKSDPSIPLDAFRDRILQTVALGSPQSPANMRLDGARAGVKLPIDFSAERKQRYANQFSKAAELLVAGARIYSVPDCSDRGGQTKVALFAKGEKAADFQWPVYGQVFDNEGRALSDCAKSTVERGADNHAYLSFEFKSTRAAGPRRTIIVARSQDLMDKRGLPKALDNAFVSFARTANDWHKRGAALSPVDVLSVSQDGVMRRVFTAEDAALQLQKAEVSISELDRTAPKTPDLSLLRLQPETKGAERVIIIMDGSSATTRQVSELRLLGSDLAARKGGSLQFFLSSDSCALWQPHAPQLRCVELGSLPQSDREKVLAETFTSFLNTAGTK